MQGIRATILGSHFVERSRYIGLARGATVLVAIAAMTTLAACNASSLPPPTSGPAAVATSAGLSDEERVWCAENTAAVLRASYIMGIRVVPNFPSGGTWGQFQSDLRAGRVVGVEIWIGKGIVITRTDKKQYGVDDAVSDPSIVQNIMVMAQAPNLSKIAVAVGAVAAIDGSDQVRVCRAAFRAR